MVFSYEGIPSDLVKGKSARRLGIDQEAVSYSENREFRFFDRIVNVANTDQLVYKFTTTVDLNVTARVIELWSGGREYLVYPGIPENVTFTGTLTSIPKVFPVNGILRDGLSSHPASGVTVERAIGAGIFSSTDDARNGTGVVTVTSGANRSSSTYSLSGEKAGVSGGVSFWLVFNHLSQSGNNATNGLFRLQWEERI